jgi:ATP-dependent Lon protease
MSEPQGPAEPSSPIPADALIVLAVRRTVLFPGMLLPLSLGRARSITAAQEAARSERPVGVLQQRDPSVDNPADSDLYRIGTIATILRYVTTPDGTHHVVCQGQSRFRVVEFLPDFPFTLARIERVEEKEDVSAAIEAGMHHLKRLAAEALELMPQAPPELAAAVAAAGSASLLSDLVAHFIDLKPEEKQEILETFNVEERLEKVIARLVHRISVLRLSQEIDQRTKAVVDKRQREYLLREQLKTIQQELGEGGPRSAEVEDLAKAIAEAKMPSEAEEHAKRELARLERVPEESLEHSMIRSYLEWLTALPWSVESEESIDLAEARRILDEDHYGLEKVKRRIVEYLAVRKLKPRGKSPILCFVGPPGVGKTSLGQSIARATGRKFVRVALGGVHDEAEIRGHRRTYVGALPGNILQGIRKASTRNPVFMLDELDKLGVGFHGDPSAALLEVLDPEQNATFRDNYLAVPFDLSHVMFIGTANAVARPHGGDRALRVHRRREGRDRETLSRAAPARGERPGAGAGGDQR